MKILKNDYLNKNLKRFFLSFFLASLFSLSLLSFLYIYLSLCQRDMGIEKERQENICAELPERLFDFSSYTI